jgi:hypothetical protein
MGAALGVAVGFEEFATSQYSGGSSGLSGPGLTALPNSC